MVQLFLRSIAVKKMILRPGLVLRAAGAIDIAAGAVSEGRPGRPVRC